jgi:TonB family protein
VTVSEILERRLSIAGAPRGLGPAVSVLAHLTFAVLLVLVSRPRRVTVLPIALPVRVVSPASLPGRPAATHAPAQVPTAPPVPSPAAAEKTKPVIEKLNRPEKIVPSKDAMPEPTTKRKKWLEPTPVPVAGAPSVELPAAGNGGAEGTAGPLSFGTSVASLDVDFPFAFYVDQMLQLIGANWLKPEVPDGTATVVGFRIQRDGRISDVRIISASGLGVYDRAAVRAIYAANPLPPLPPEFRGENLGIHLRFH